MHDQGCFTLAQVLALDDEVEQLTSFAVPVNIHKLMVESLFAILVSQKGFENQNRFFAENIMSALDLRRVFLAFSKVGQSDKKAILTPAPGSTHRSTPRSRAA